MDLCLKGSNQLMANSLQWFDKLGKKPEGFNVLVGKNG